MLMRWLRVLVGGGWFDARASTTRGGLVDDRDDTFTERDLGREKLGGACSDRQWLTIRAIRKIGTLPFCLCFAIDEGVGGLSSPMVRTSRLATI